MPVAPVLLQRGGSPHNHKCRVPSSPHSHPAPHAPSPQVYAGLWLTASSVMRPLRLSLALAVAPAFDRAMDAISARWVLPPPLPCPPCSAMPPLPVLPLPVAPSGVGAAASEDAGAALL